MDTNIDSFTQEILEIAPSFSRVNPFGPGIQLPVVGSRDAALAGGANASTDLTNNLRRDVIEFAQAYKNDNTTTQELRMLAQKIEGSLMMEETLSVLSKQKVDHLIDSLHLLMEAKNGA